MPASTLFAMAIRCAQRNIDLINDLADMPIDLARPIIMRVHDPNQLHEIEVNCPQLADHTGEYWQKIIKREMPNLKEDQMYYPKNPRSWHKVYKKLKREEQERELAQEEELRQTLLGDKVKKAEHQAVFVGKILAHARDEKVPALYVDGVRNKRQSSGWGEHGTSVKRAKTGGEALSAIRKQTAQTSWQLARAVPFRSSSSSKGLSKGGNAPSVARQIPEAPPSMLRQAKNLDGLEFKPRELYPHEKEMLRDQKRLHANTRIATPGRAATLKIAQAHQRRNEEAAREARQVRESKLRALTQQVNPAAKAQPKAKFEFEQSRLENAKSASPPAQPAASTPSKRTPAAASSPQQASPPPQPTVMKKKRAPVNIFANTKKPKR
jgi:elongin-A